MTDEQARKILVQAMRYANITDISADQWTAFEAGTADIDLDRLGVDSLATMELCIAIEANGGLSITPEQLKAAPSGNALARLIVKANQ